MPGRSLAGQWRAGAGWALLLAEQAQAQITERVGAQPRNVHLGNAELPADLRLRHVAVKAHQQDPLLPRGQLTPVPGDGAHTNHPLDRRVLRAQGVSQGAGFGLIPQRYVQ